MRNFKLILTLVMTASLVVLGMQALPAASRSSLQGTALATQPAQDLTARLDEAMASLNKQGLFNGSILIAKDGQVLLSKGYGMADFEHDVPNTPQTKFRLFDFTQSFTATAILILQERGKLNVQDKLCKFFEQCPDAWKDVTIHHLLTHTSSIPDYFQIGSPDFEKAVTLRTSVEDLIARFKDKPLRGKPGESWLYSYSNYALLGYIIEKVAGEPYAPFVQKNIFEPLGMADSGYDSNTLVIKHRATRYVNPKVKASYMDVGLFYAAGGLYSTITDLYVWDQALSTAKLVSQATLGTIFKSHVKMPTTTFGFTYSPEVGYGYGWIIDKDRGHVRLSQWGFMPDSGFVTEIRRYPDDHITVIVLGNIARQPGKVPDIVADQIFGKK